MSALRAGASAGIDLPGESADAHCGFFISLEGGDGVGKSTQAALLVDWLRAVTGREVVMTREPGGTELGRCLREVLLHGGDMDTRAEALVYAADRADHVAGLILPALRRGAIVVTDRYLDSSVAYQGGGRELPASDVEAISLWAARGLLPDLTILLDVDLREAASRRDEEPDRMEQAGTDFHRRTRDAFLARAAKDPGRWLLVDTTGPVGVVQSRLRVDVAARLHQKGVVDAAQGEGSAGGDPADGGGAADAESAAERGEPVNGRGSANDGDPA